MIYLDDDHIPVDHTGDGGDSANRLGLMVAFGIYPFEISKIDPITIFDLFEISRSGILMRHPFQVPWCNWKNFSRDQLIPFVAGLNKAGKIEAARRIFWSHAKRLFFCQNIERDVAGSTKHPYPHEYVDDKGVRVKKLFDYRDPLLPHDISHLIRCARIWWLYWFLPVGYLFLIIAIWFHCKYDTSDDEGQILCEALIAGPWAVKLYLKWKPEFMKSLDKYWSGWRQQQEIATRLTVAVIREAAK